MGVLILSFFVVVMALKNTKNQKIEIIKVWILIVLSDGNPHLVQSRQLFCCLILEKFNTDLLPVYSLI